MSQQFPLRRDGFNTHVRMRMRKRVHMAEEDQYQKPVGEEGAKVLEKMNEHHKDLSAWGIACIPQAFTPSRILDIGCGGGNAIRVMSMKWPRSVCDGIDISEKAVEITLNRNRIFASIGRIRAQVAGVSNIPFPDGEFDLITAIETYFFWPDLPNDLKSAASKLRNGGIMVVISEQYFDGRNDTELTAQCEKYHMKLVSNDEMVHLMEDAGMTVTVTTDPDRNWVTFVGKKK